MIAFKIFGINNTVALYTSTLFSIISIVAIFFLTLIITSREDAGLIASSLLAFNPLHIRWAGSAETNTVSLFFVIVTFYLFWLYFRSNNLKESFVLFIGLFVSFTMQFRPENIILVGLFLLGVLVRSRPGVFEFLKKVVLPLLIALILALPNLIQVMEFQISTNWVESQTGGKVDGSNWALSNLKYNSIHYGLERFLLNFDYHPPVLLALFVVGLIAMLWERKEDCFLLILWLVTLWTVYFSSWFHFLARSDRFYLGFYPIIIIFASYGFCRILDIFLLARIKSLRQGSWVKIISSIFLLLLFGLWALKAYSFYTDDAFILESKIPEIAEKQLPENCLIVSSWPHVLTATTFLQTIDTFSFIKSTDMYFSEKHIPTRCMLFFEDIFCFHGDWWNKPEFKNNCEFIKNNFMLSPILVYRYGVEEYAFYNITSSLFH